MAPWTTTNPDPAPAQAGFGIPRAYSISGTDAEGGRCFASNAPWQWQIASSQPEVPVVETPTSSCPPDGLELSKATHDSVELTFNDAHLVRSSTPHRVQAELYEALSPQLFCEPAYDADCTPVGTMTANDVVDNNGRVIGYETTLSFPGNLNRWYQARGRGCTGTAASPTCGAWSELTTPFQLTEPGLQQPSDPTLTIEPDNRLTVGFTKNSAAWETEVELYAYTCTAPAVCEGAVVATAKTMTGALTFPPQNGGLQYTVRARSCILATCAEFWTAFTDLLPLTRQALVLHTSGDGTVTPRPPSTHGLYGTGGSVKLTATGTTSEDPLNPWEWNFVRFDVTDAQGSRIRSSNVSPMTVTMNGVRHVTATFHLACTAGSGGQQRQSCSLPTPPDSAPEFPEVIPLTDREFTFIQNAAVTDPVKVPHAIGGNETVAYSLSNKPAGLNLVYDADGDPPLKLTGTATALQSRTMHTLTARDDDGDEAELEIYITVKPPKLTQDMSGFGYSSSMVAYGGTPPTVAPPPDAEGALSYTSSSTPSEGVCRVHETTGAFAILGVGECEITVTVAETTTHAEGTADATVTVVKAEQDMSGFTYSSLATTVTGTAPTVVPPPNAEGELRYSTSSEETICEVTRSTGTLTINGVGDCVVTATAAVTDNYNAGTATVTVVVSAKKQQTLHSFSYDPDEVPYGDTPSREGPLGAQTAVTYTATPSSVCSVILATGAFTTEGVGTCTVTATAAETDTWLGDSIEAEVEVVKADQDMSGFKYTPSTVRVGGTVPTVTPPPNAEGTLRYASSPPDVCRVDRTTGAFTIVGATGDCVVAVTAAMTSTHRQGTGTFTVTVEERVRVAQPLTNFSYTPSEVALDGSVTLNEPEGAVGALSYEVDDTAVCTVGPTTGALTLVSAGTCNVTAKAAATTTHLEGTATTRVRIGYRLMVSAIPATAGWLAPSPRKTLYDDGDTVELTANTISNAWVVSGWGGDCSLRTAKDATCTLTMDGHKSASITLEADTAPSFALTTKRYHTTVGRQVSQLLPGATGGNGPLEYSLSGNLPPGHSFSATTRRVSGAAERSAAGNAYWSTLTVTDCDGDTDTLRIRIYIKDLYDLTILIEPSGYGTATGAGEKNEDEVVTVTATPSLNTYAFEDWDGDVADTTASSTTITMTSDQTITANFLYICDEHPGSPVCARRSPDEAIGEPPTVTIETEGQSVSGGSPLELAATATTPTDGKIASHSWSGPGSFSDATAEDTTWTAPAAKSSGQRLTLTLTASTAAGASASASIEIVVPASADANQDDGDEMDAAEPAD